jgi:RNA ligase (TIGR02306 family)
MRKLVTIREVKEVRPIEKADAIECISVDGWTVVSKKGEFQPGDKCVFFEIDSFLPADDERYAFLIKGGVKKDPSGKERIRLKTVKLRGQLSQGLALPIKLFPELKYFLQGEDVSSALNVIKYERPEPKTANAAGHFPDFIKKTDEERIQNVYDDFKELYKNTDYYATMKLDGSSCTVAFLNQNMSWHWRNEPEYEVIKDSNKIGEFKVCSRNLELKPDPESHFYKAVLSGGIVDKARLISKELGCSVAIQGEVMGPGIQGNKDKFNDYQFFAFNIFNIDKQEYLPYAFVLELFNYFGVQQVPLITQNKIKPFTLFGTLGSMLDYADGYSINSDCREGIVMKPACGASGESFKIVSNRFLMKGGDE